jgi:hypothetical protein
MTWRVEPTLIDEYVPAPREAWRVVNDAGEVADDSVTEDQDTAQEMADEFNADESPHRPRRGDDVETWLKRKRDELSAAAQMDFPPNVIERYDWMARGANDLLDRYRECADYGLTLRVEDDGRGDP